MNNIQATVMRLFNYTNIAFLSKTIERIAATQTMNYLTGNDLLPKFQ